uniref:Uncharacterized protein n=1 Tax=Aegilops tauschii subsp. strangulata TaxID=200361 RepID=A0A453FDJ8_AEGTS
MCDPKNKYRMLQMMRSAKGDSCEDAFESMENLMCAEISPHIVFSEVWWVETKEQNP